VTQARIKNEEEFKRRVGKTRLKATDADAGDVAS